jgi:hypothetical protein
MARVRSSEVDIQDSESVSDLSLKGYGASWRAPSESPLWPETNARLGKVNEHIIEIGYDRGRITKVFATPGFQGFAEEGGNATSYALQYLASLRSPFGAP